MKIKTVIKTLNILCMVCWLVQAPLLTANASVGVQTSLADREITQTPLVTWFGANHSTDEHTVGGKGASLSHLQSVQGIQVPEGFIITTAAYKQVVSSNIELQHQLELLDDLSDAWLSAMLQPNSAKPEELRQFEEQLSQQSELVRQQLLAATLPESISANLIDEYTKLGKQFGNSNLAVAVRSSATAEDLPHASFAGQHDSFINQQGKEQVIQSVIACWASLFHPHTVLYRNQARLSLLQNKGIQHIDRQSHQPGYGLKHTIVGLAVVVQRVINAKAAGVGFNVHPTGKEQIHIEANYGLGETVVSALANPDTWEINSEATELLTSKLGRKQVMAVFKDSGGVDLIDVTELDQQRYALTQNQVMSIAQSIRTIGEFYKKQFDYKFIDTEFVIDEHDQLYFVQARPETVFSSTTESQILGISKAVAIQNKIAFVGGATGYAGAHSGRLVYAKTPQEALQRIKPGDILLTTKTTPNWSILFPKLGGIIVDVGGVLSHTAIVGREQRIPTLLSTGDATTKLKAYDGSIITLDSLNGVIYEGALPTTKGSIKDFIRDDLEHNPNEVKDLEIQIHLSDEDGKWMARPNTPLSTLQLQFAQNAYEQINALLKLEQKLEYKVIDKKLYIKIEDANGHTTAYKKLTDILLQWDLDQLQKLFADRVATVNQLLEFSERFEATPEQLREFQQLYQDWMTHLTLRGRFGHGAIAVLMQAEMKKIPDPSLLSSYLNLRYPVQNETHAKSKMYRAIQSRVAALNLDKNAGIDAIETELQVKHPNLWQEINAFAGDYEHVPAEDIRMAVPIDLVLSQLLEPIEEEVEQEHHKLTSKQVMQMDAVFAQDERLAGIMILSHQHLYQKENEHHCIARIHHRIKEGLLLLGQQLTQQGVLAAPEHVFDHDIDTLIELSEFRTSQI